MTGASSELVENLNQLLQELTSALQQLRIHKAQCGVWGYQKLGTVLSGYFDALSSLQDQFIVRLIVMDAHIDLQAAEPLKMGRTVEDILSVERSSAAAVLALAQNCFKLATDNIPVRKLIESVILAEDVRLIELDQSLELLRQMGTHQFLSSRC